LNEKFDVIISSAFKPETIFEQSIFESYYSVLHPGGSVYVYVLESNYGVTKQLEQNLLISGFTNYSSSDVEKFECQIGDSLIQNSFKDLKQDLVLVKCSKPNYKVRF